MEHAPARYNPSLDPSLHSAAMTGAEPARAAPPRAPRAAAWPRSRGARGGGSRPLPSRAEPCRAEPPWRCTSPRPRASPRCSRRAPRYGREPLPAVNGRTGAEGAGGRERGRGASRRGGAGKVLEGRGGAAAWRAGCPPATSITPSRVPRHSPALLEHPRDGTVAPPPPRAARPSARLLLLSRNGSSLPPEASGNGFMKAFWQGRFCRWCSVNLSWTLQYYYVYFLNIFLLLGLQEKYPC